jgi:hypothetical protein
VTSELKEKGVQTWQSEWDASNMGELTKTFFPIVKDGISKRLQMCINFSTITGHGKLRTYFRRFKMSDDPTCLCKMSPQTTDHLLWVCDLLKKQRQVLRTSITKAGGNWPITNSDLANKYTKFFQRFVNTINFEIL